MLNLNKIKSAIKRLVIKKASESLDNKVQPGFPFYYLIKKYFNAHSLHCKEVKFLDELYETKIQIISEEQKALFFPPVYLNKSSRSYEYIKPEVAVFRLKKITTWSRSRVFVSQNNTAIIERAIKDCKVVEYSGNKLLIHGSKGAIFLEYGVEQRIECGILISGFSDENYYHVLIEIVPQLEHIKTLPVGFEDYPILISEKTLNMKSIKKIISAQFPGKEIIQIGQGALYVGDLIIINQPNNLTPNLRHGSKCMAHYNITRSGSLRYIQNCIENMPALVEIQINRKIYLARKKESSRKYNQESIIRISEKYGFTPVFMEDYTIEEQGQIFKNSEYIIGPSGAAWTNLIFCKKGTRALCWMPEEVGDLTCFSDLAIFSETQLFYMTFKTKASIRNLSYTDYNLDEDEFEYQLQNLFANR
jgi:hypothetical protein